MDTIARDVVDAAGPGLQAAKTDPGLHFTFYLLTQLAIASRSDDWISQLQSLGLDVRASDGLVDLLSAFLGRVDDHFFENNLNTDVGEMARQAAGEAISALAAEGASTLFGEDQGTVQVAIRPLSTSVGFGRLGQEFFGRFMARFLNFYVSRVTAAHVGTERLPQLGDLVHFNDALRNHCRESALIVRDFTGAWYSKTQYLYGIDQENVKGFVATALRKLESELAQQREE